MAQAVNIEKRILKFHPQPRWILFSFFLLLVLAAATPYILSYDLNDFAIWGLFLVYFLLLLIFVIFPLFSFMTKTTLITNAKIVIKKGFFARQTTEIYLSQLTELHLRRSIPQRLFKSGDIIVHTSTGATVVLNDIPNCVLTANALQELLRLQAA